MYSVCVLVLPLGQEVMIKVILESTVCLILYTTPSPINAHPDALNDLY